MSLVGEPDPTSPGHALALARAYEMGYQQRRIIIEKPEMPCPLAAE
jgi:hypothetical protein